MIPHEEWIVIAARYLYFSYYITTRVNYDPYVIIIYTISEILKYSFNYFLRSLHPV